MTTCNNTECEFYHMDLEKHGLLDWYNDDEGYPIEYCKACGKLCGEEEE